MSVAAVFARVTKPFAAPDSIKDQFDFAMHYAGFGFYGGLATVTTDTMYKINKGAAATFTVTGSPVALPKAFMFYTGWNYVPCAYQTPTAVGKVFGSASLTSGDVIKSQMKFTTYYVGFGWFGELGTVSPGEGYKMRLASGGAASFPA